MVRKRTYDILGVKRDATQDEIRKAFRKLAAAYHPDAGGDEKKFKEIPRHTPRPDEKKRKEYDQLLMFGGIPGATSAAPVAPRRTYTYTNVGGNGDWSDILNSMGGDFGGFDFSSIFGGAGRQQAQRPAKGGDLTMRIDVTFDEALNGATRKVSYRVPSTGEEQTLTVKIPAGAVDGGKLRYRGRGEHG